MASGSLMGVEALIAVVWTLVSRIRVAIEGLDATYWSQVIVGLGAVDLYQLEGNAFRHVQTTHAGGRSPRSAVIGRSFGLASRYPRQEG
ncbi:hypothetical protein DL93DRAFT_2073459 [Clavulina sp. PMI_390]|nr:hypothetical protein DL93DRAFT_2073459 [Clavulina sp. PMI_390]